MKLPVAPPPWRELFGQHVAELGAIMSRRLGPEVDGRYEQWDHLRHLTPPDGLTTAQWWLGIKLARSSLQRELSMQDKQGAPFTVVPSDCIQRRLFLVARDAAGALRGQDSAQPEHMERYLVRSLLLRASNGNRPTSPPC